MGDKHSVSAETESSSPPLSLSNVNVRRSVSPPTNLSLEACGIYDEQVNGNVSPSQVRSLVSSVSPKAQRTMSPTQEQAKLSPASIRDDAKLSPTSSTHSVPCQGGSGPIGVSRKYPHGGGRCMAGACLARAGLNADSCQHVGDTVMSMNGDTQKDNMSRSNNSDSPKSPVSSPKALSPVVQVRNGGLTPSAESQVNTSDADTKTDASPATDTTAQIGACKTTSPSDTANLTGRGCLGVTATPFPALPPPYRVTRTSPIPPHKGQNSQSSSATQQDSNVKKSASGGSMTNGLPTCQLPVTGTSFASTVQCQPASPGSSVAGSVASFSFDGAPGGRQKQTLGELLQQIDVVSRALRSKGDFTCPDFLPDLQFLAHQSRYNSDVGVRRRIISRLVDAGILEISIKVFWFLSSADYLGTVATATTMAADHNDNMDESTESIPMLLARGRQDHRRPLMASQGKMNSVDSECQSQVSMTDTVKIIHAVITCLQYTTERSAILCEGCVRRGLMQMMLLELADPRLACTDPKDQCKVYVVKGFLSILGNIIRNYGDGRFAFRLAGALRVLQLHLKSPLLPVKIKTIILLSYVVTETENEIVNATDKNIGLVVKMLQTTVDSNNHFSRKYGFSASEAVAGKTLL
ncbi:hypothetical protein NP493_460g04048 [Ridgeia piscesae]|uniref:Uncharacterized protein n=1 Tax=Ridgeia piscesae TaxID=27915 RepID=A0AAD9KYS1_RIDPI|nr:hypothetical protein NP493_460g04048 [Ridgeia piscesae]